MPALIPEIQIQVDEALQSFRVEETLFRTLLAGPISNDLVKRGILVENHAKRNATHSKPSIPGEGPAVQTGRLRASITWRLGADAISPYVDIGSAVFYAPFVENGTRFMEARPFLRPALESARATF